VHIFVALRDEVSVGVDDRYLSTTQDIVWFLVQHRNTLLKVGRIALVISRQPPEILSSRLSESKIVVPSGPVILLLLVDSDSVVLPSEFLTNGYCLVRRSVIGNNELKVLKGLIKNGLDGF